MKVLATCSVLLACAHAQHVNTYSAAYPSAIPAPSYQNQAYAQGQALTVSASGTPAVYRTPFLNRNGVVSRNPDAVWNDPVEYIQPPIIGGAQFIVYGDPGYGAYRGNFGGLSSNSGYYGYKSSKSSAAKA